MIFTDLKFFKHVIKISHEIHELIYVNLNISWQNKAKKNPDLHRDFFYKLLRRCFQTLQ